jgi:hypothetical protein
MSKKPSHATVPLREQFLSDKAVVLDQNLCIRNEYINLGFLSIRIVIPITKITTQVSAPACNKVDLGSNFSLAMRITEIFVLSSLRYP